MYCALKNAGRQTSLLKIKVLNLHMWFHEETLKWKKFIKDY